MPDKIKVGDTVQTIKGPKIVTYMNHEVVRFEGGFAPIDMVVKVKSK